MVGYFHSAEQCLQFGVEGLQIGGEGRQRWLLCIIQDVVPEVVTSIDAVAHDLRTQVGLRLSSAGRRAGFVLNILLKQTFPIFPSPSRVSSSFSGRVLTSGISVAIAKVSDEKPVADVVAFWDNRQPPAIPR